MGEVVAEDEIKPLTRKQKEKAKEYANDNGRLKRALAGVLSKKKKSPRARQLLAGDNKVIVRGILDLFAHLPPERRKKAHDIICVRYQFCDTRKDTNLVLSLIPALMAVFTGPYSLPFSVLVAIVIYRPMNILCECPDGPLDQAAKKMVERLFKTK